MMTLVYPEVSVGRLELSPGVATIVGDMLAGKVTTTVLPAPQAGPVKVLGEPAG